MSSMIRRLGLVACVAASAALVACNSSESGDAKRYRTTTTEADSDSAPVTTTTVPDPAQFDATLERLDAEVDSVRGDVCGLIGVLDGAGAAGNPSTPEQATAAARFLAKVYGAFADAAPPELAADAARIREAADGMIAETEASDFDVEKFMEEGPAAFNDEDFVTAVSNVFATIGEKCGTPTS